MALTEEQFDVWWKENGIESATFAEKSAARKGWKAAIAALPKPETVVTVENVLKIQRLFESGNMTPNTAAGWQAALEIYTEAPIAPPASAPSEQKPCFECWSTNEGDSWYESPADAELLYDVLGDSPKVGDEFEVMSGWCSVPARYRIVSQTDDDDFEVECISHPYGNTAPNPTTRRSEMIASVYEECAKVADLFEEKADALNDSIADDDDDDENEGRSEYIMGKATASSRIANAIRALAEKSRQGS